MHRVLCDELDRTLSTCRENAANDQCSRTARTKPASQQLNSEDNLPVIPLKQQLGYLLLLALPVACATWTVTHEEIFREPREFCKTKSENCRRLLSRKFFYLFTCEYCFSHYVSAFFLILTRFQLLYAGWRGYLMAWFALVFVANAYMSVYNRLRLDIKLENVVIAKDQAEIAKIG
jgi:hypothetical protein